MAHQSEGGSGKKPARRKPFRSVSMNWLLPNMLTIGGLVSGLTGLRFALDGIWMTAVALIVLGGNFRYARWPDGTITKINQRLWCGPGQPVGCGGVWRGTCLMPVFMGAAGVWKFCLGNSAIFCSLYIIAASPI